EGAPAQSNLVQNRKIVFFILICAVGLLTEHARASDQLIRSFAPGAGLDAVGVIEANPDAGGTEASLLGDREEIEGPQALHAGERGEIYILDQVNGRVLQLDPKLPAERTRSLRLPEGARATDLVVLNEGIYIWDGQPRALRATGPDDAPVRGLNFMPDTPNPDQAVTSAFAQMGSEVISPEADATEITRGIGNDKTRNRSRQVVATHGKGQVTADLTPISKSGMNKSGVHIGLRFNNGKSLAKLEMRVKSRIGAVEVLAIDRQGRIYVLGENIPTDASDEPSTFVARYGQNGALEGVFQLPYGGEVALSRRSVTVSPEGDVYFLRTRKGSVDLLGVGFRPLKKGQVIDLAQNSPLHSQLSLADFAGRNGATAAVRVLNRAQVIETALRFANVRWRVNAGAYGSDPDRVCTGFNRIRRPGYLHGKLSQEVVGIPYCWGCHGSLPRIAATIGAGRLAGNVCTRDSPRFDVTGVDCSAFISACWGLSTHFTTIAIPAIARQLTNPWDLLPGDALNKPGSHVMLFVRFTPDRRAEVIESSTGGCNGKVCRNISPLDSLLARGYRPVR
ncbi:MAG: hypothetical protein ACREXT_09875, partial [Gammaproteobacteria bacterium]